MITSFEPIIDKNCKILVLGTMPSAKSLEKQHTPFPILTNIHIINRVQGIRC
jgi:G:T/U-mismatch repair DNA glycosylase